MAKLVVQRSSSFISRARAFKVILDGQTLGSIKNGETAEFEIPAGTHTLRTGISAMSGLSPVVNFSTSDNETVAFTTAPHPLMIIFLLIAIFFGVSIGLSFSRGAALETIMILIIPILVCAVLAMKFAITLKQTQQ